MAAAHPLRRLGLFGLAAELFRELRVANRDVPTLEHRRPPSGWMEFGSPGLELKLVIVGDSLVSGSGVKDYWNGVAVRTAVGLTDHGFRVKLENLSQPGARARDVRYQATRAWSDYPDLVVVCVGGNDARLGWPLASYFYHLRRIIQTLKRAHPATAIVMIGVPDLASIPRLERLPVLREASIGLVWMLNHMVAVVARQTGVYFAPLAKELAPELRHHPEHFSTDRFHPGELGDEKIAAHLVPHLVKALERRSEAHAGS